MLIIFMRKIQLKERIMNMLRLQKKLKSAGIISALTAIFMIIVWSATACQPTPKEAIVQNKGDDDLKNAIAQTAAPTAEITQPEQAAATATEEPKIIVQDVSSNASNTVTVDINAEVINRQPQNIPVAKIASAPYTNEELLHMIDVFFGNAELFTRDMTKEDYDRFILEKQFQMTDKDELQAYADIREITDLSVAKRKLEEVIERLKGERSKAPDERKPTDIETAMNSKLGLNHLVKTREGFWGSVDGNIMTAFNDGLHYYISRDLAGPQYIEPERDDEEFLNAKQIAIDMVAQMGIDNVVFADAYLQEDVVATDSGPQKNGRVYYVFCFDTAIGNSVMDNTGTFTVAPALVDMSGKDGFEDVPAPHYDKIIPYDSLQVWVEGDKVVQFSHRYPIEVTQIINDNVDIAIDYTQATELAKKFAYTAYIDPYGLTAEIKLDISRIELVLLRIKEKDTRDDIVVPVWNFCGTYRFKHSDGDYVDPDTDEDGWAVREGVKEFADVLITVNALDGTIVNTAQGYWRY